MTTHASPSEEPAEWWKSLTPEQQASFRRVLGKDKDWFPNSSTDEEPQFDETRRRIREIERRALAKIKKGGEDEQA